MWGKKFNISLGVNRDWSTKLYPLLGYVNSGRNKGFDRLQIWREKCFAYYLKLVFDVTKVLLPYCTMYLREKNNFIQNVCYWLKRLGEHCYSTRSRSLRCINLSITYHLVNFNITSKCLTPYRCKKRRNGKKFNYTRFEGLWFW